ncbi:thymidylate synthase, flavin-dependent [Bacteroides phage crAss001]|jgi:thymidylate synthase (FAD)|uniref:Thymidylate synthase, flavin-dependent n=1 Tax=Bacteroides phage crAss001 TaxID=2301731 RepID=A0A385DVF0_BPCA1|nr:thymidylate synthase, flavin-dependent [Bacteroides phage crAss001]AXQ62697.1 thymidylate synthase, flavin-dependent [Bacteroides phage crAss001]
MRIIKPSFEIWDQQEGLEGIYKQIERAGRVCYKSEDKITETSAKEFVERMIKSGHGAMLEHGTVYLLVEPDFANEDVRLWELANNKYSEITFVSSTDLNYITTNYRVLVENDWLDLLKYQCNPTEYHKKRITVKFICDRGVSHEFVRHRVFSFAQESTRYCNYSKDKFGNEITYILPIWSTMPVGEYEVDCIALSKIGQKEREDYTPDEQFIEAITNAEWNYFHLLQLGWTPQQARAVLPNSLKTELVMTGFISDWEHFFKLRDAGNAHPQARELAHPLHMEFLRRNYLVDLYDEANPD